MTVVKVNRKGSGRIRAGHPWVFASDILDRGDAAAGDGVTVHDEKGLFLGTALFSAQSQITIRMVSREREMIDRDFFKRRIGAAQTFRESVVRNTDAYRLVYSEADGLPGLVVDRYGSTAVVQFLTQAMDRFQSEIVNVLRETQGIETIIARNDVAVREKEGLVQEKRVLAGDPASCVEVKMNGLRWWIDPLEGQKTGIYLDQRENYVAAAAFAKGTALDCFTSTGGFALHLAERCERVEAVDSSAAALKRAKENAELNAIGKVVWRQADVFDVLTSLVQSNRRFDTIILDPPAFTKTRGAIAGAARGYRDINTRALRLLNKDGILVTCCCSHHFSEAMLLEAVAEAALDAGRTIRVLERRTQSRDHPILLTVPETHYLKCLILQAI